jgi:hypothetical protein
MLTRRQFVAATAGAWLCAGLPRAHARGALKGPRYFVTFFLRGGIDAVYTLDPKSKGDVEKNIDVPYNANEIVDAGTMTFGPHFAKLTKWAPKMAVVRGVQVKTANHETGAFQMVRMRTQVTTSMPSLYDIIGQERDENQALASVTLGDLSSFEHSPGAVIAPTGRGNTSLDAIDEMSDEDVAILARVYKGHLERFPKWQTSPEATRTREHVSQAAAFFERMKTTPRFNSGRKGKGGASLAEDMQRTLWFLENDLTRGVCLKIFSDWDSHYRNADKQLQSTGPFVAALDQFLTELHTRKNKHGVLADQTVVIIGSELGRFPIINGNLGKDHFPEAPYIFMGPGINVGNAFVPTGKKMEGLAVSAKTGKPGEPGAEHIVLDDLGTTMLHMAGMNPSVYGYRGRRLDFLVRA